MDESQSTAPSHHSSPTDPFDDQHCDPAYEARARALIDQLHYKKEPFMWRLRTEVRKKSSILRGMGPNFICTLALFSFLLFTLSHIWRWYATVLSPSTISWGHDGIGAVTAPPTKAQLIWAIIGANAAALVLMSIVNASLVVTIWGFQRAMSHLRRTPLSYSLTPFPLRPTREATPPSPLKETLSVVPVLGSMTCLTATFLFIGVIHQSLVALPRQIDSAHRTIGDGCDIPEVRVDLEIIDFLERTKGAKDLTASAFLRDELVQVSDIIDFIYLTSTLNSYVLGEAMGAPDRRLQGVQAMDYLLPSYASMVTNPLIHEGLTPPVSYEDTKDLLDQFGTDFHNLLDDGGLDDICEDGETFTMDGCERTNATDVLSVKGFIMRQLGKFFAADFTEDRSLVPSSVASAPSISRTLLAKDSDGGSTGGKYDECLIKNEVWIDRYLRKIEYQKFLTTVGKQFLFAEAPYQWVTCLVCSAILAGAFGAFQLGCQKIGVSFGKYSISEKMPSQLWDLEDDSDEDLATLEQNYEDLKRQDHDQYRNFSDSSSDEGGERSPQTGAPLDPVPRSSYVLDGPVLHYNHDLKALGVWHLGREPIVVPEEATETLLSIMLPIRLQWQASPRHRFHLVFPLEEASSIPSSHIVLVMGANRFQRGDMKSFQDDRSISYELTDLIKQSTRKTGEDIDITMSPNDDPLDHSMVDSAILLSVLIIKEADHPLRLLCPDMVETFNNRCSWQSLASISEFEGSESAQLSVIRSYSSLTKRVPRAHLFSTGSLPTPYPHTCRLASGIFLCRKTEKNSKSQLTYVILTVFGLRKEAKQGDSLSVLIPGVASVLIPAGPQGEGSRAVPQWRFGPREGTWRPIACSAAMRPASNGFRYVSLYLSYSYEAQGDMRKENDLYNEVVKHNATHLPWAPSVDPSAVAAQPVVWALREGPNARSITSLRCSHILLQPEKHLRPSVASILSGQSVPPVVLFLPNVASLLMDTVCNVFKEARQRGYFGVVIHADDLPKCSWRRMFRIATQEKVYLIPLMDSRKLNHYKELSDLFSLNSPLIPFALTYDALPDTTDDLLDWPSLALSSSLGSLTERVTIAPQSDGTRARWLLSDGNSTQYGKCIMESLSVPPADIRNRLPNSLSVRCRVSVPSNGLRLSPLCHIIPVTFSNDALGRSHWANWADRGGADSNLVFSAYKVTLQGERVTFNALPYLNECLVEQSEMTFGTNSSNLRVPSLSDMIVSMVKAMKGSPLRSSWKNGDCLDTGGFGSSGGLGGSSLLTSKSCVFQSTELVAEGIQHRPSLTLRGWFVDGTVLISPDLFSPYWLGDYDFFVRLELVVKSSHDGAAPYILSSLPWRRKLRNECPKIFSKGSPSIAIVLHGDMIYPDAIDASVSEDQYEDPRTGGTVSCLCCDRVLESLPPRSTGAPSTDLSFSEGTSFSAAEGRSRPPEGEGRRPKQRGLAPIMEESITVDDRTRQEDGWQPEDWSGIDEEPGMSSESNLAKLACHWGLERRQTWLQGGASILEDEDITATVMLRIKISTGRSTLIDTFIRLDEDA